MEEPGLVVFLFRDLAGSLAIVKHHCSFTHNLDQGPAVSSALLLSREGKTRQHWLRGFSRVSQDGRGRGENKEGKKKKKS